MLLDSTITAGNIIEITTIILGMIVTFTVLRTTVAQLKIEVSEIKDDVRALNKVVIELAVTDRRLTAAEEDIRELRHGRGFIREALQGEWPK